MRKLKYEAKRKAGEDTTFHFATFDLQSILQLPSSDASPLYYMRKLIVHNLTFYDGVTGKGTCYLWTELDGKKGSSEIGSIIIKYLQSLRSEIRHILSFVILVEDKTEQFVTALIFAASSLHFDSISINFLEPGHMQMECDSMHSAIERAKRNTDAFSVDDWINIMKRAIRDHPYKMIRLGFHEFF